MDKQITLSDLPNEILIHIALQMDLPELAKFCNLNKNQASICQSDNFWIKKIQKDFNVIYNPSMGTPKDAYPRIDNVLYLYKELIRQSTELRNKGRMENGELVLNIYGTARAPDEAPPVMAITKRRIMNLFDFWIVRKRIFTDEQLNHMKTHLESIIDGIQQGN